MTQISDTLIPSDVMTPILLQTITSLTDLKIMALVSKSFKSTVENPLFLHSFLVKSKGDSFYEDVYAKDPRKFLVLDRDINCAFTTLASVKLPSKEEKARELLEKITSIALKDLKIGLFTLSIQESTRYFRFPETQIEKLKTVNFDSPEDWNSCITDMANSIIEYDFPIQINLHFAENITYLEKIKCAYLNPNEKMKKLVHDYGISDIFFGTPSLLLINTHNEDAMFQRRLQEAVLEPEEHNRLLNLQIVHDLLKTVNFIFEGDNIGIELNKSIRNEVLGRLKDEKCGQKECMDQIYNDTHYKFLFGLVFPEIWPTHVTDLRKTERTESLNFWLVNVFSKSIKVLPREEQTNATTVEFNRPLAKFLLERLRDTGAGLKKYIDENYTGTLLLLLTDLIFREIWHAEPLDPEKGVLIPFNTNKKN